MMSKHKRIKEQIFEQEDQFYLEDGDINVRLAIPAGSYYFKIVMLIKVKKVSESVVVIENEIAANTEKDCYE